MTGRASLLLAALLTLAVTAAAATIDGVAASVNGKIITILELEKAARPLVEKSLLTVPERERAKVKREILADVLDKLILRQIQMQRAEQTGIRIDEAELDATIANIMEQGSLTEEMLARALEEEGLSHEEYREQIADQILFSKLMQREIRARVAVTHEELDTCRPMRAVVGCVSRNPFARSPPRHSVMPRTDAAPEPVATMNRGATPVTRASQRT